MKNLSLKEKIDLIIEYADEIGEPIVGNTVYKDREIGRMAIMLRYGLKKGKYKLSEEQLSKLQAIGVLDSQIDTIDEKVERLERFAKNYPDLWLDRKNAEKYLDSISDIEKREQIKRDLEAATASYEYIVSRHYRRKLPQKYYDRLKEAGVRGAFGYKEEQADENERIMNEYGISQNVLNQLIKKYGSIDSFREKYIQSLITGKNMDIPKELMMRAKLITGFDLSSPDLVCRENGYVKLFREIFGLEKKRLVIDKTGIECEVEDKLDTIAQREALVVTKKFGLRGEKAQKLDSISPELGISRQTVSAIKLKAIKKLSTRRNTNLEKMIFLIEDDKDREAFLRKYFSKYDIFYKDTPEPIDEKLKAELLEIVVINKIKNTCKSDYDKFISRYLNNDYIDQIIKNRNSLELANLRNSASSLVKLIKEQIEEIRVLDENSKKEIYKKLYKTTDLLRIMIEANYEQNENETEQDAATRYFSNIEELIEQNFNDNDEKKEELRNALKLRKSIIIKRNKAYLKSLIGVEYNSEDYIDEIGRKQKIMDMSIEELDLSIRSYNALNRRGIKTVYDWLILTDEEKSQIRNLGVKSRDEIEEKMIELKISAEDVGIKTEKSKNSSELKSMILRQIEELYLDDDTREELHNDFDKKFNNPEVWKNEKDIIIRRIMKYREDDQIDEADYSGIPIEELDLTVRAYCALKYNGIDTVEQYTILTNDEKILIRSLSSGTIAQIDECIEELGKSLKTKRKEEILQMINDSSLKDEDKTVLIDTLNGGEIPADFMPNDGKKENDVLDENDDIDTVLEDSIEQLRKTYEEYGKTLITLRTKKMELMRLRGISVSRNIDAITEQQRRIREEREKIKEKIDRILGDE